MSKRVVIYSDDDFEMAEGRQVEATETVLIGLDGEWRVLDLNDHNATHVRKTLTDWMHLGAKPETPPDKKSTDDKDLSEIQLSRRYWRHVREYAKVQGWKPKTMATGKRQSVPRRYIHEFNKLHSELVPDHIKRRWEAAHS